MKKKTAGRKATTEQQTDLYQQVTDKIITALENGVPPWRRPWRRGQKDRCLGLPVNAVTGRPYSGVNMPLLWLAAEEAGYSTDCWLTYQQAKVAGGRVRKGERSSLTIIFKPSERRPRHGGHGKGHEDGDTQVRVRSLQLFNVAQCEDLPETMSAPPCVPDALSVQHQVREIFSATGVMGTHHGLNRSDYISCIDTIVVPEKGFFQSPPNYMATVLHELVHATGHASRLGREGITSQPRRFDNPVYALEELIADTGTAFLCAQLGIAGRVQHDSYVDEWLKLLRNDKKAFFRACRLAREASEYLLKLPGETRIEAA
ncbi:ArdC family protein [Pantoea sp. SJZ147]|uniref:ArdC family protein n=1 Tax=Pantoea sp. SJZ147 TaxID=2572896 RepID=UPI0011AA654E|nr:ArdC-like ssDNA-binding domain-containing protein [Pantoea sp. SJZ147]TWD39087.1 antirestriction protein ArdC [Pantoea sp. SJZ147]